MASSCDSEEKRAKNALSAPLNNEGAEIDAFGVWVKSGPRDASQEDNAPKSLDEGVDSAAEQTSNLILLEDEESSPLGESAAQNDGPLSPEKPDENNEKEETLDFDILDFSSLGIEGAEDEPLSESFPLDEGKEAEDSSPLEAQESASEELGSLEDASEAADEGIEGIDLSSFFEAEEAEVESNAPIDVAQGASEEPTPLEDVAQAADESIKDIDLSSFFESEGGEAEGSSPIEEAEIESEEIDFEEIDFEELSLEGAQDKAVKETKAVDMALETSFESFPSTTEETAPPLEEGSPLSDEGEEKAAEGDASAEETLDFSAFLSSFDEATPKAAEGAFAPPSSSIEGGGVLEEDVIGLNGLIAPFGNDDGAAESEDDEIFESDKPWDVDIEFDEDFLDENEVARYSTELFSQRELSDSGFDAEPLSSPQLAQDESEGKAEEEGGALSAIEETSEFDDFLTSLESAPPPPEVQEALKARASLSKESLTEVEAKELAFLQKAAMEVSGEGAQELPDERDILFDDVGAFESELEEEVIKESKKEGKGESEEGMDEKSNKLLLTIMEELSAIKQELASLKGGMTLQGGEQEKASHEASTASAPGISSMEGGLALEQEGDEGYDEELSAAAITDSEISALMDFEDQEGKDEQSAAPAFEADAALQGGESFEEAGLGDIEISHITAAASEEEDYLSDFEGIAIDFNDVAMEDAEAEGIDFESEKLEEPELESFSADINELSASVVIEEKEDGGLEAIAEEPSAPAAEKLEDDAQGEGEAVNSEVLNLVFEMPPDDDDAELLLGTEDDLGLAFYEAGTDDAEEGDKSVIDIPEITDEMLGVEQGASPFDKTVEETAAPFEELYKEGESVEPQEAEDAIEGLSLTAEVTPLETEKETSAEALPNDLRQEIKAVLSYMDQLLDSLPEEKIEEFARSKHFEVYKKLFEDLGIS